MDTQVDQHILPQSAQSENSQFQQQGHSAINVNSEPTQKDSSLFKDYEDHNSSLIFGGNITNDDNVDDNDTEIIPTVEDQIIVDRTVEDVTEADDKYQNDDTISPFLKKLKEMIDEQKQLSHDQGQTNGTHSEYLKSYSRESFRDNGNDDTQIIIQRHYNSNDNYDIESSNGTSQQKQTNSKIIVENKMNTQDSQLGDTQVIGRALPDTQIINNVLPDTQVINKVLPDTQVIKKVLSDTQIINKALADTQVIPKLLPNTQVINRVLSDTQVIQKNIPESQVIQLPDTQTQSVLYYDSQKVLHSSPADHSQAISPSHNKKTCKSQTQVLNTQDLSDISTSEDTTQEHASKSVIEIQTDSDEDESEDKKIQSKYYDDSLTAHQFKRKLLLSPQKIKRRNTELIPSRTNKNSLSTAINGISSSSSSSNKDFLKTPGLRQYSVPLVLASPTNPLSSSSPLKKQLNLDEEDKSIQTDKIEEDSTSMDIAPLPSSPNKGVKILFEEEHEPSDLEEFDIDIDQIKAKNKAIIEIDDDDEEEIDDDDDDDDSSSSSKKQSDEAIPIIAPRSRANKKIIDSQSMNTNEDVDSITEDSTEPDILRQEESTTLTEDDIINHDSVWAIYNLKMYTGRIVAKYIEDLNIEFDEGTYNVKNVDLNVLDIRIGDTVNVKGNRHKYTVTGLSTLAGDDKSKLSNIKCMRGYNVVYLRRSQQKPNLNVPAKEFSVILSDCFMELSDWIMHQQKYKLIIGNYNIFTDEAILPSTPKKSQKYKLPSTPLKSLKHTNSEIIKPNSADSKIFQEMIFCITSIDGDRKMELKSIIETNGGILWDKEIHELFLYHEQQEKEGSQISLNLTCDLEVAQTFNFIALISNNFCRSAKYLQALALGWPIISDVYIDDCLKDTTNKQKWTNYLLPSGLSKKLTTIKSIDIFRFKENYEAGKMLVHQFNNNHHVFNGLDILILQNKSINHNSMETCKFIFYAFGAKSLQYFTRTDQIIKCIKEDFTGIEDNITIYDESNDMVQALTNNRNITGKNNRGKPKSNYSIKLIDWEWVVQCVINGAILESPKYTVSV